MAATPAGSDSTPDPTHPFIKLNAAVAMLCFCSLDDVSSLPPSVAPAEDDAFIPALTPLPLVFPPPREIDNVFLPATVFTFAFALTLETAAVNGVDDVVVVVMGAHATTPVILGRMAKMVTACAWKE